MNMKTMNARRHRKITEQITGTQGNVLRLAPIASAMAMVFSMSGMTDAHAQQVFSRAWYGKQQQQMQQMRATGVLPNGQPITNPQQQQQQSREQLQRSWGNVNRAAQALAASLNTQQIARNNGGNVPVVTVTDGVGGNGLVVDLSKAWQNATLKNPVTENGQTKVTIEQDAARAIAYWDSFNVGKNTHVHFDQQGNSDWAILNKVSNSVAPSQIQGKVTADGTVLIVNNNGVVFTGTSQINVRNLLAAAANISDSQFMDKGIYVDTAGTQASFTNALGNILVDAGAQITTHLPTQATQSGGYVLLLGQEVHNAGEITTDKGQTTLAAGDSFAIRKGVGTDGNAQSTTRGNEVAALLSANSLTTGKVVNTGVIKAATGDITLTGHDVIQHGVAVATTSTATRGTIHLLNSASDTTGKVTLGKDSVTMVLLDASSATALDSQKDAGKQGLGTTVNGMATGNFDNLGTLGDFTDLSRIEITSGNTVDFESGSLTLATGGQVAVIAKNRTLVRDGAEIDVSGAVGVAVGMESNSIKVNIQGNEQRDASVNRDGANLNNSDVWVDIRDLVYVPAGTNGYATDRWYTAGGLLEVSGYLGTMGHTIGEWMAQGGTVQFSGKELVTQAGSNINLSGGTIDVATGYVNQTWLKGSDGKLYEVSSAPGDLLYTGVHKGFEVKSERYGVTKTYYNPLMARDKRLENGYTVGRDAGKLIVSTHSAVLEGGISSDTYQGAKQTAAAQSGLDGYHQSHHAVARDAQLIVGDYRPVYDKDTGLLHSSLTAVTDQVQLIQTQNQIAAGLDLTTALPADRQQTLVLNTDLLNGIGLGALKIAAKGTITVDDAVTLGHGGDALLYGAAVKVNADVTAHSGTIQLGNVLNQYSSGKLEDQTLAGVGRMTVADGVHLDVSGLWSNTLRNPADVKLLAYVNGGKVALRSSGDVILGYNSLIDVSSGAALTSGNNVLGGRGGDVTLQVNAGTSSLTNGTLALDGTIHAVGVNGGGKLAIQAGKVLITDDVASPATGTLVLEGDFFNKGFSAYEVIGKSGVVVADNTQVAVTMPVYMVSPDAAYNDTQTDKTDVLTQWTPPLYQDDPVKRVLKQRSGASLLLQAGAGLAIATPAQAEMTRVDVGTGSLLQVDPGQTITIRSEGQITVDGTLRASGGKIVLGAAFLPKDYSNQGLGASSIAHTRMIRVGEAGFLDASAQAITGIDQDGVRYGQAMAGGSIVIGGEIDHLLGRAVAPDVFVVLDHGSRLDVSGSQVIVDIASMGPVVVAGNGGRIALSSLNGLYLDGDMRAVAGGSGAAGGTLSVALETGVYNSSLMNDSSLLTLREVVISQQHQSSGTIGVQGEGVQYGHANLSVDQINAGGFDNVSVLSQGVISFKDDVALTLGQSLQLYAMSIGLPATNDRNTAVQLNAPYVRLAGVAPIELSPVSRAPLPILAQQSPSEGLTSSLTITAGLIDVRDKVELGMRGRMAQINGSEVAISRDGFANVIFNSSGDLRFLHQTGVVNGTSLKTPDALLFNVAQLYPETNGQATVSARHLDITRSTETMPNIPYSVFGALTLQASTINQGGIVRAPLGTLVLSANGTGISDSQAATLQLLPGSVTSISAAGLTMPYGGTTDGENYQYGGKALSETVLSPQLAADWQNITLEAQSIDVQAGAIVDLSGGGDLTGAGFVSGRGGSTDARFNPLVQISADGHFSLPGHTSNPVYAIVPGMQAGYAPGAETGAGQDPMIGQQITIGSGVPGLVPGVYTLLPSTYALQPGAFRVELNGVNAAGASFATTGLRNGSWIAAAQLSINHTDIHDNLFRQVIVTSADTLRRYSQYNETSLADFIAADAAKLSVPRAALEKDAKGLTLSFLKNTTNQPAFNFDGIGLFNAKDDGRGSVVTVLTTERNLEILADGMHATSGMDGVSIDASQLNGLNAASLRIGGRGRTSYGQGGNYMNFSSSMDNLYVRSGAVLSAAEIILLSNKTYGGIYVEEGATITTLGYGKSAYDSRDGFIFDPLKTSMLLVSNGWLDVLAPTAADPNSQFGPGSIFIGACAAVCSSQTQLYSEGTIAIATDNQFELGDQVRYGTRNLSLAVGAINVGSRESLNTAADNHILGAGLMLNQSVLERLLRGDGQYGAPALETLSLTARDALNFYGTVTLDTIDPVTGKSSLVNLVLGTPAIYGHGNTDDVALIRTGNLIWNGAATAPGSIISGGAGTGSGRFVVDAERIEFGYGPNTQPKNVASFDRLAVGFTAVQLNASAQITANNRGSLSVYQHQGAFEAGKGYQYSGGDLTMTAPLVTGAAGSVNHIKAGGNIVLTGVAGKTAEQVEQLGGELSLQGKNVTVDTTVALPSGKLTLRADYDVTLSDDAMLDLAGRTIAFNDVKKYSWGGEVILESLHGNIHQTEKSVIDVSATHNQGGLLTAIALDATAGEVDLQGKIEGSATGYYDAGGTYVPYKAGGVVIRAQHVGDFAALNTRLNDGHISGSRTFQIKQGDLFIGDEVKAGVVDISLDNGQLTVAGKIDASGERTGNIRLSAKHGLRIAGTALLDTHSTVLRVDSYGKIIDSPNRAMIALDSGEGRLVLDSGAQFDLRSGTGATTGSQLGQHDGKSRGTLELTAPRLGDAVAGDIQIDARGNISIQGARSIAVNGNQRYDDTDQDAIIKDGSTTTHGQPYREITQAYLDKKHLESDVFIKAVLDNADLMNNRLAGLNNAAYADALHIRPSVEIVTSGNLVVQGDLDLSGYRYESINPHTPLTNTYGSGEVGTLTIRAGGHMDIYGSITDGFMLPATLTTPDDNGWVLLPGKQPFGGDVIVPGNGVVLADGTLFEGGKVLNYDLPVKATTFAAGVVLPTIGVLAQPLQLAAGTVVSADVHDEHGVLLYPAGTLLKTAVILPENTRLAAGTRLIASTELQALVWPKGIALPFGLDVQKQPLTFALNGDLALLHGAVIPSQTDVKLPGDALSVDLRAISGTSQGRNWAIATMLPEGSQSWSLALVAGADTDAADVRAVKLRDGTGNLTLADTHYSLFKDRAMTTIPATPPEGRWVLIAFEDNPDYSWIADEMGYRNYEEVKAEDDWLCIGTPEVCLFEAIPGTGTPAQTSVGDINAVRALAPVFSVLRTGTGDLQLVASDDISLRSTYGVYTAGTQASNVDAVYLLDRGTDASGTVLGGARNDSFYNNIVKNKGGDDATKPGYMDLVAEYEQLVNTNSLYRAWYPEQGGNVLLAAGGNLTGDVIGTPTVAIPQNGASASVGNWLWRQGSGSAAVDESIATAWWINFGSYALKNVPQVVGFTGFGALGGGDINVFVGGDAGTLTRRGDYHANSAPRSEALVLAVGSTGRVDSNGNLMLTGGGDLNVRISGSLNPALEARAAYVSGGQFKQSHDLNGSLVNLRGNVQMNAGAMGGIALNYGKNFSLQDVQESRAYDPFTASVGSATGGMMVIPGDATISLNTRGDLVLGGAADAGRTTMLNDSNFKSGGTDYRGTSWFSLWTDHTAIDLFSAGGNLTPSTQLGQVGSANQPLTGIDSSATDGRFVYPAILRATAAGGSMYYGMSALSESTRLAQVTPEYSILLAPSASGQLALLARDSIYGSGYAITPAGASISAVATPFNPAFSGGGGINNLSRDGIVNGTLQLLAFGSETLGASDAIRSPSRFYALNGDLVGVRTGEILTFEQNIHGGATWYVGATPVWMKAGRDIVGSGTTLQTPGLIPSELTGNAHSESRSAGNLFVHNHENDFSSVSAGRDIIYSNFSIAGPGTLEISAGRHIRMEDKVTVTSLGGVAPGDLRAGANIVLQAGIGAKELDYSGFLDRYLDAANLAATAIPLAEQSGKVVKIYQSELADWVMQHYGVDGTDEQIRTYFSALPAHAQNAFARTVYFAELQAGGREYTAEGGVRQGSYLRGRNAISALFPQIDSTGNPVNYNGNITMYGGAGVQTRFGGNIQMLTPGGSQTFGIEGGVPPSTAGIVTQGNGNIQLYSKGSILLGQSRVMTTFGGSILGWSGEGDINAGRGAKTTLVYTPPRRVYDQLGNVALSPQVPSSGAGIATLNPIAEVVAGDIDLIAPLGTIDAGEAGIRVSGNVNIAALHVVNADNIKVQGDAAGIPMVAAANIGALTSASTAANAAVAGAQEALQRDRANARDNLPSVFTVRVLGFGNEPVVRSEEDKLSSSSFPAGQSGNYNKKSTVQVAGLGNQIDPAIWAQLTTDEKRRLEQDR
jgi:filamentous hemagglutinin family protein